MWFRKMTSKGTLADEILDRAFDTERRLSLPEVPLAHVQVRVESQLAGKQEETSVMARLVSLMTIHRRFATGMGVVALLVVFATLVPLPYSVVSAYRANVAVSTSTPVDPNQYVNVLKTLGISTASVNVQTSSDTTMVTIEGLKTKDDARKAVAAFAPLTGVVPHASIEAVRTRISGTLFAQAIQKVFRAEIQTSGKSDAEIAAEVENQIRAQGGEVKSVEVQRSADGQTSITVEAGSGH